MRPTVFDFDPPKIHVFDAVPPIPVGQSGGGVEAVGHWSNVDVYLDIPILWADAAAISMTLAVRVGGIEVTLASTTLAALTLETAGTLRLKGLVFQHRGRPGEAFIARIVGPAAVAVTGTALIRMVTWGTESTPEESSTWQAPPILKNMKAAPPNRAALGFVWNVATTQWEAATAPAAPAAGTPSSVSEAANAWGPGISGTIAAGPPAAGSSITAGVPTPALQYVDVSAKLANAGTIFVASRSVANGLAEYELAPGDSVRILINDAALVFVNGSVVGDKWSAARV